MIFRKKKEKNKIIKYNTLNNELPPELKNSKTLFEAWCNYPAMKTCPTYKNMNTYAGQPDLTNQRKNKARQTLEYFNTLKTKVSNAGHAFSMAAESVFNGEVKTIRSCPAIKDTLTHTLAVKAPVDLHFAKSKNKDLFESTKLHHTQDPNEHRWFWTCPNPNLSKLTGPFWDGHPKQQFCYGEGSQFEGYSSLKINTALTLELPDDIICIQHAPVFHKIETPYVVIPGLYVQPFNKLVAIIFNVLIKDTQEDFIIPKGDVLYYLTFSETVKFEEDKSQGNYVTKFKFNEPNLSWKHFSKKQKVDGND